MEEERRNALLSVIHHADTELTESERNEYAARILLAPKRDIDNLFQHFSKVLTKAMKSPAGVARPLWVDRKDYAISPPDFIKKHYSDLIEAHTISKKIVRAYDPTLMNAFYRWAKNNPDVDIGFDFPAERKMNNEMERELYGEETMAVVRQILTERAKRSKSTPAR